MMGCMALQTEHGLAHCQQTPIHGAMRRVALGAVFHHGSMLISEWTFVFRVALQAELIDVVGPQILPGRAAMRIMAIGAGHFSFPNRVVVRKIGLGGLRPMAANALLVLFLEGGGLRFRGVHSMAVDALHVVALVRSQLPVQEFVILCMTAQANAVGLLGRPFAELDDLLVVRTGYVQTSVAMAVFALQFFKPVNCVVNALRCCLVTCAALLRSDSLRTGYLKKSGVVLRLPSSGRGRFRRRLGRAGPGQSEEQKGKHREQEM